MTVSTAPGPVSSADDHEVARAVVTRTSAELARLRALWPSRRAAGREALALTGDRVGHAVLAEALRGARPADALRSEEAPDSEGRGSSRRVWIVDPLDGSREFAEVGRKDWATQVALWADGELTAAAVGLPALGAVFSTGPRARRAEAGCQAGLRVAVSRSRPPSWTRELAGLLGAEMVAMGSCGAKAMAVLEGRADAYVHDGGQWEWDSAAPVAVARAGGLHASRLDGGPHLYNQDDAWLPDLLICRPEITDRLLEAVASIR